MTDRIDGTELNATQRDLLFALAAALEGPAPPDVPEVRSIAMNLSTRFSENSDGTFYKALDRLDEEGLVERGDHPTDGRVKRIGMTLAGEEVLQDLAERSEQSAMEEI